MRRLFSILALLGALLGVNAAVSATTLEQLSLPDMARKSTAIVRARIAGSYSALRGAEVYTVYRIEVLDAWKGGVGLSEVAVPGGVAQGIRQEVAGAPALQTGDEYLLFTWTSRSGITQIIGLTQGLFRIERDPHGEANVNRPAASELMLDAQGRPVHDEPVRMKLVELKTQVQRALKDATVTAWAR